MQSSGGGPDLKTKAEASWKEIIKNPKLNDEWQARIRQGNVKSQEEAQAVLPRALAGIVPSAEPQSST